VQRLSISFLLLGGLILGSAARANDNELTPKEVADGWQLLFDGQTTNGWTNSNLNLEADPIEDGALTPYKRGAYFLMTDRLFSDFILQLDFKTSENCNSGIFVRADPQRGLELAKDTAWYAFEVAIDETEESGYHATGAIYDLASVEKNVSRPVGEWNHLVVTCDRNLITVELNGEIVSRMNLDEWITPGQRPDGSNTKFNYSMRDRAHSGFIGLQDHGSPVWFKNIKVKPLHEEGFRPLFDGKTLQDWTALTESGEKVPLDQSDFRVTRDSTIDCAGDENSYWIRVPGGPYGDFTLRLEYRVSEGSNSGIFLRATEGEHPAFSGMECQVIDDASGGPTDTLTSGAVYDVLTPMRKASRRVGEWNELEIAMTGRKYVCRLNGMKVIDADFDTFDIPYGKWPMPYSELPLVGHIGLQNHGGQVWFRNLRIKTADW
jgi:Domain of Unknown Function (DUF1080)